MTLRTQLTKWWILFIVVGFLALVVYIRTLAPTITWRNHGADSGDLAAAVAVGGVPHPPGYPTYLILGEAFKLLPFKDIAYRLNLLSATCAALAVAVLGLTIHQTLSTAIPHRTYREESSNTQTLIWLCAASASLTLAFSGAFWSQAVIAEVYALNALLAAVLLFGALKVQPSNERWLLPGLFVLLGLSLGNHPSILLLLPMLVWVLKVRWHRRLIVHVILAFCAGLCIYLIIPLRAASSPPINWGMATTFPNFVWLVSAEPYRQFLFALPWEYVPVRVLTELHLLPQTFLWWGLPVGILGLQRLTRHHSSLAYGSLLTVFLISTYAIGYNTIDSYVYLLPAFLVFSLWVGWGLYDLGTVLQRLMKSRAGSVHMVAWGIVLLPFLSLSLNLPAQNISQRDEARSFARQSLQLVAPGAVVIADNDAQTFALWYGRYALALRPDVAIVNSNLLHYAWYRQILRQTHTDLRLSDRAGRCVTTLVDFIELNISGSTIYLATIQPPTLEGYRLEPADGLQRVVELRDD
jgi:hypothetical protein